MNHIDSEGVEVDVSLAAALPEGVVFHAYGLPASLTFDTATGVVSGTLDAHSTGEYRVQIAAITPTRSDRVSFTWSVL